MVRGWKHLLHERDSCDLAEKMGAQRAEFHLVHSKVAIGANWLLWSVSGRITQVSFVDIMNFSIGFLAATSY